MAAQGILVSTNDLVFNTICLSMSDLEPDLLVNEQMMATGNTKGISNSGMDLGTANGHGGMGSTNDSISSASSNFFFQVGAIKFHEVPAPIDNSYVQSAMVDSILVVLKPDQAIVVSSLELSQVVDIIFCDDLLHGFLKKKRSL